MTHALRYLVRTAFLVIVCSTLFWAQGTTITLLHVNDTHSHLDATGPKDADLNGTLGGIARAATMIGTVRATEENVLLLHAGDVFQGDLFFNAYFGVPEFQLMQSLGFDAMTVGNHEFDFGPGVFRDVLATAFAGGSFPLVSANLDMSAFPDLQTWITPSTMKTIGGVKIGIFGLTVPNNPTNQPAPVVIEDNVVEIAQQTVQNLRADGADVVIFLSHLGVFYDRIVAANVTGIDMIIGGHDHYLFTEPVLVNDPDGKVVRIFQAGEHYEHMGKLHFTFDNGTITFNDYTMLSLDGSVPPYPDIQAVVEELKVGIVAQFGDMYHTVVGTAQTEVTKRYNQKLPLRDTPIGNLVTDAYRATTGTEIGLTALGLISEKIYAGPIVGADIFRSLSYGFDEATGFGFKIATFDISGANLVMGMEIGLSQLEVGDDYFLQYSGMRFTYDPAKPVGERVDLNSIRINNKKWNPFAMYSVTVNTGIVALLQILSVPVENLQLRDELEYNVVRDYIASIETVSYHSQGRIRETQGRRPAAVVAVAPATVAAYPNPFNPSTTLSFTLAQAGRVTLVIYNALGQEVARLADGEYDSGTHAVRWNAGDVPSGIYFSRFSAPGFSAVNKLMLVK